MGIFSWFGSNARVEEALYNSKTYDMSPSNDDEKLHTPYQAPQTWEEFAYSAYTNSNNKSKLTLVSEDERLRAVRHAADEKTGWVQTNKR